MNIENFDNVEIVKLLAYKKGTTQKALAEKLGKHPVDFSKKIHANNLKLAEFQKICDILGYEIILKEK